MRLRRLAGDYAVCRLDPAEPSPAWLPERGELIATVRTAAELSVVCEQRAVPADVRANRGWAAFAVDGPLDLGATGVLAELSAPLAAAGVPLFAVSSFDTDYLLVPGDSAESARAALGAAGHALS